MTSAVNEPKFKLEDILNKQKALPQILDLANVQITSSDHLTELLAKIPDYRLIPDSRRMRCNGVVNHKKQRSGSEAQHIMVDQNVSGGGNDDEQHLIIGEGAREDSESLPQKESPPPSEIIDGDESYEFKEEGSISRPLIKDAVVVQKTSGSQITTKCKKKRYEFADPCPQSMRSVKISELSSVDINWKMLTLSRPQNKIDEDIFSKLVHLDKLRLKTRNEENRQSLARGGTNPFFIYKNPSSSRGGVAEKSIKICSECQDEFCSGECKDFQYDSYQRIILVNGNNNPNNDKTDGSVNDNDDEKVKTTTLNKKTKHNNNMSGSCRRKKRRKAMRVKASEK